MKKTIQKGFTLIELLVVIAIIGILAGILFIAINPSEQSDKAKIVKIANNLKLIEKTFQLTALDKQWGDYPIETGWKSVNTMIDDGDLKYIPSLNEEEFNSCGASWCNYSNYIYKKQNNSSGAYIILGGSAITPNSRAINLFEELDRILDSENGKDAGKVTWTENYGGNLKYYIE